jgi:hypothetical protein
MIKDIELKCRIVNGFYGYTENNGEGLKQIEFAILPYLQAGCHRFDPCFAHQKNLEVSEYADFLILFSDSFKPIFIAETESMDT